MATERQLSRVLGEFARTMVTDFPIQGILDHLVLRIVEILPVTAAGVTLITPTTQPRYVASSDQSALRFEELQTELGEGPCLAAYRSGEAVVVADLASDERFEKFRPRAVAAGLGAVFTFPLRQGEKMLGALDLYRDTAGALSAEDMEAAQTLADVTSAYLVNAELRDEAIAASQRKSDFLASMSHEIRTPMNGVMGMTELLLETDLDERQRDFALTVGRSGDALLRVIDDILDLSRVEAGKLRLENKECDLRAVIDDLMDLMAEPAQSKGVELIAAVDRSVPVMVLGDAGRIRQVLTNLVGNAIKFTRVGEIVVRVRATTAEMGPGAAGPGGANTVVRFEVSDTGDGIPPEKQAVIFQPFVQGDSSTSGQPEGSGLGLTISSQLAALMGGDIGLTSRLGVGSTFWFTVRLHAEPAQPGPDLWSPDVDLRGVTALIVDDNATKQSVLAAYLTSWGMSVTAVDSGPAALSAMHAASSPGAGFDLTLVDQMMPGMDGLDLANGIALDPALTTRVVLMTEIETDIDAAFGVAAVLSKPVRPAQLHASIRTALGLQPSTVPSPGRSAMRPSTVAAPAVGPLLLAEDNPINRKVTIAMLSSAGYQVDAVADGAAAVVAAAARIYAAILMDTQMPGLDGFGATAAIRAQEGSSRHTPIIALTASALPEDKRRCLSGGMDAYLAKPTSKAALLATVARYMQHKPVAPTAA